MKSNVFLIKLCAFLLENFLGYLTKIYCVAILNGVKKAFCAKQPGLNTYPISHNLIQNYKRFSKLTTRLDSLTLTAGCVNLFSILLFVYFLDC